MRGGEEEEVPEEEEEGQISWFQKFDRTIWEGRHYGEGTIWEVPPVS